MTVTVAVTTVTTVKTVKTVVRAATAVMAVYPTRTTLSPHDAGTPHPLRRGNSRGHGRALAQSIRHRRSQCLRVYSSARGGGFEGAETAEGPETAKQQPTAASDATRTTGRAQAQPFGSILGIVDQRKQLSMQQRYRALVLTMQAFVRSNALLQQLATTVDGILMPLRARKAAFDDSFAAFLEDYEQYLAMETKARWSWEKRHRKEMAMLASIPPYIGMALATVLYEVFVPCSLGFAVLLPLYMSWVLYDRWYLSPVVLGMVLIARWKFAPVGVANGVWSLVWPGLV